VCSSLCVSPIVLVRCKPPLLLLDVCAGHQEPRQDSPAQLWQADGDVVRCGRPWRGQEGAAGPHDYGSRPNGPSPVVQQGCGHGTQEVGSVSSGVRTSGTSGVTASQQPPLAEPLKLWFLYIIILQAQLLLVFFSNVYARCCWGVCQWVLSVQERASDVAQMPQPGVGPGCKLCPGPVVCAVLQAASRAG